MRILSYLLFAVSLGAMTFSPTAHAASVLPLSLEQLTHQAGTIFVGRCEGVETALDERGMPATYARFQVAQGLKGAREGGTLLIKQFGAGRQALHVAEGQSAVVAPKTASLAGGAYRPGADYLLFLYPESDLGFTSPVGGGQGRFEVERAGAHGHAPVQGAYVVNPLGNRFLKTLGDGPVALDDMVKTVRAMVEGR